VLEAIPTNVFGKTIRLQQKNELVGEVDISMWRENARLELKEGTYTLSREGFCSGDFLLARDGNVIARATKPRFLQCSFEVDLPTRHLTVRKLSIWNRRFGVFEAGKQVGSVYPQGIVSRRSNIDLPADLPLPDRIFVFWLAYLVWKRQNGAAAS
jgi:hypothetical protein